MRESRCVGKVLPRCSRYRRYPGGITLDLPMHIAVTSESMNPDVSITSRLGQVFYLWGSRLKLNSEK